MSSQERQTDIPPLDLDILPSVSFDISLGKKYRLVDFDYKAYVSYLTSKGLTTEQISESRIDFLARGGLCSYFDSNGGFYYVDDDYIGINIPITGDVETKVNDYMMHETQHKIDYNLGKAGNYVNTLNSISNYSQIVMKISQLAFFGSLIAEKFINKPEISRITDLSIQSLIASTALYLTVYLGINPIERNARKASKNYNETFVHFTKRSQPRQKQSKVLSENIKDENSWIIDEPDITW